MLRLCNVLGIPQKPASQLVRETARKAATSWLESIQNTDITPHQRRVLLNRLSNHAHIRQALGANKDAALVKAWESALLVAQQQDSRPA